MSENATNTERPVEQPHGAPVRDLTFLAGLPGANHSPEEIQKLQEFSKPGEGIPEGGDKANTPETPEAGSPGASLDAGNEKPGSDAQEEVQTPEVFAKLLEGSEDSSAIKPTDIKEVISGFKSKYEIDLESIDGLTALQSKYEELLEKSGNSEKATNELKRYQEYLLGLPEPLKQAILALEQGRDFNTAYEMATGKIVDFSKPFESHKDTFELVKKLLPKLNLTKADFEDDPDDPRVQDAIELAKEKYDIKQREVSLRANDEKVKMESEVKKVRDSITRSFTHAANVFKNTESADLKKIQTVLAEGRFDDLFFDKDGFREDAIEKLVYAEHAPKMIAEQSKTINTLKQQLKALSNQIAEANGKSPDVSGSVGTAKGLGAPVLPEVKTPEEENKSLESYSQYLESKRKTTY